MIEFSTHIMGRKKLIRGFGRLEDSIRRQLVSVLPEIGLLLEANARDMAPVDTGRLRASIGHFNSSYLVGSHQEASAADSHWVVTPRTVEVGTKVPYAGYVLREVPFFDSAIRLSADGIQSFVEAAVDDGEANAFGDRFRGMVKRVARRVHRGRHR